MQCSFLLYKVSVNVGIRKYFNVSEWYVKYIHLQRQSLIYKTLKCIIIFYIIMLVWSFSWFLSYTRVLYKQCHSGPGIYSFNTWDMLQMSLIYQQQMWSTVSVSPVSVVALFLFLLEFGLLDDSTALRSTPSWYMQSH